MVHFLYIRKFYLIPGRKFGYIGSALEGNQIFMVSFFHSNVSCRHHADGALQLWCCNDGNPFFFYVGRTGGFDTDGVIIGLDENVPSGSRNENPLFVLDVTLV